VKRYPAALIEYMRRHGRAKVLFGSNYPMIAPARALDGVDALGLDDEAKTMFLAENARRVFKLAR
jgi:predicted TIM-barrel fold metal-dependent hydrolase